MTTTNRDYLGNLAKRTLAAVTIAGQRVERRVWRAGEWVAFAHTWGWHVHRGSDIGSHEIITGLDREVAILVCQDMAAIARDRHPDNEIVRLDDLKAVLRKYLGGLAL